MAPIPVIQRGFGGSKLRDLVYYAGPIMLKADGTCNDDLLWWDGVHLNRKGYKAWAKLVKEKLDQDLYLTIQ